MNGFERPAHTPKAERTIESLLNDPRFNEFVTFRKIQPDSYPIILELASINKNTLVNGMHNFFHFYPANQALPQLMRCADRASSDEDKKMYELFISFLEKNDVYAARHLVAVLEGLK